ncbi:MAG TPA: hypothetical protein VGK49_05625 [Ilumatobacteraceae bacterium]
MSSEMTGEILEVGYQSLREDGLLLVLPDESLEDDDVEPAELEDELELDDESLLESLGLLAERLDDEPLRLSVL